MDPEGNGNGKRQKVRGMKQNVLLGDSIFDNAAYARVGPDVISHLNSILPQHWNATLLAVNRSVSGDAGGIDWFRCAS